MKALVISEKEEILEGLLSSLSDLNLDLIVYKWFIKALDNLEEIRPDFIFLSAKEFFRKWKILVGYMQALDCKTFIYLFHTEDCEDEEKKKIEAFNCVRIFNKDLLEDTINSLEKTSLASAFDLQEKSSLEKNSLEKNPSQMASLETTLLKPTSDLQENSSLDNSREDFIQEVKCFPAIISNIYKNDFIYENIYLENSSIYIDLKEMDENKKKYFSCFLNSNKNHFIISYSKDEDSFTQEVSISFLDDCKVVFNEKK